MRVDVRNPFARYIDIVDLETGQKLLRILWADDEKGEYAQYPERTPQEMAKSRIRPVVKRGRIEIRFDGPDVKRRAFDRYMDPNKNVPTEWPPKKKESSND